MRDLDLRWIDAAGPGAQDRVMMNWLRKLFARPAKDEWNKLEAKCLALHIYEATNKSAMR